MGSNFLLRLKRRTSERYIQELDGLRFLAIALVVFAHFYNSLLNESKGGFSSIISEDNWLVRFFTYGHPGVLLFFCISGFILTYPILKAKQNNEDSFSWKNYLLRRLLRIEPPYIIVLSLFFIGRLIFGYMQSNLESFLHYLASFFYIHNIVFGYRSTILPVAWSLEIEVQFYLVAPFIAMFYVSFIPKIRMVLFSLLILLLPYIQWLLPLRDYHLSISLLNYLQYFLSGLIAADVYASSINIPRLWRNIICVLSFVALVVFSVPELYLKPFMPFVLMFCILTGINSDLGKLIFGQKILYTIGGFSYSIYLLHMPVLVYSAKFIESIKLPINDCFLFIFHAIISISVLLILGGAFYLLVERSFMVKKEED